MPSRGIGLACALALPAIALAGCAILPSSGLSASEARSQFYSELDETQAAAGGAWDVHDDPTARGCVIPLWVEGEKFPGLRIGPAPRDPSASANAVWLAWTAWGYTVERTRVGEVIQLQARGDADELLLFRVSSNAMTLQGESECRPKDA